MKTHNWADRPDLGWTMSSMAPRRALDDKDRCVDCGYHWSLATAQANAACAPVANSLIPSNQVSAQHWYQSSQQATRGLVGAFPKYGSPFHLNDHDYEYLGAAVTYNEYKCRHCGNTVDYNLVMKKAMSGGTHHSCNGPRAALPPAQSNAELLSRMLKVDCKPAVAKAAWKYGYCTSCSVELTPAMDGERAKTCSKCARRAA